jgi:RHS repeat-associated protein
MNVAQEANGGLATSSSNFNDGGQFIFTAAGANNGVRSGAGWGQGEGWNDAPPGNSFPDWLQVDFNGSKTINEVDVFTGQDNWGGPSEPAEAMTFSLWGLTGFEVQYWNGSAWATVPGGSVSGNNKVWRKIVFSPITTTKIRVLTNAGVDGYSRIVELEAWGWPASSNATAQIHWLVTDHLGTPRIILDQSGALANVSRHDYLPFGEELFAGTGSRTTTQGYTAIDNVRQKFTEKERDGETGFDYFGARYYSSVHGRFTSVDPVALTVDRLYDPQKINLYAYCRNNPYAFIDPTGEKIDYANKDAKKAYEEYEEFLNKDPKRNASELATLRQLKDSDVTYVIKLDESSTDFSNGKEGNLTSDGKLVFVNIANAGNGTEKFSFNSRIGHELEHARQFDSGEFAFAFDKNGKSIGTVAFDISEEVKAWQVSLKLASNADFKVKGGSLQGLEFSVLKEFRGSKTDDERSQVLARISNNYESTYARGGYDTNFTVQGVAPGTLIRPRDRQFNNGTVRMFGRTHKP